MYESQIVEIEDVSFEHYINHFDELEESYLTYDEEFLDVLELLSNEEPA